MHTILLEQRAPFTAPQQFYFPLTDAVNTLSEVCLESKGSVRVFALHLCVTLHPARAPSAHHSPSPLSDHFTAIWTKPNSRSLWEHNTVKDREIVLFSSVFSWKSVSCAVIGLFLKIELFFKYLSCMKDQNPLFFLLISVNFNMQPADAFFAFKAWDYLSVTNKHNTYTLSKEPEYSTTVP